MLKLRWNVEASMECRSFDGMSKLRWNVEASMECRSIHRSFRRMFHRRCCATVQVIVTTPEKWDVITRKSSDVALTSMVRLLIIDEVPPYLYRLYLGIADGMSIARAWACRYSEWPPRRGGHFEYRPAHTRAIDMPSAMPK